MYKFTTSPSWNYLFKWKHSNLTSASRSVSFCLRFYYNCLVLVHLINAGKKIFLNINYNANILIVLKLNWQITGDN